MRAVNLLPVDQPRRRKRRMTAGLQLAIVSPFLVGSLLTAGYLLASSKVNDNKATLQALQGELASIPPRVTTPSTNAQLALQRDERIAALGTALQGRIAWDRILREVSSVLPDDVWLTQLSAVSPGVAPPAPPPAPPPTTTSETDPTQTDTTQTPTTTPAPAAPSAPLGISGYTYSQEGVARLLGRLALIPELENVKLGSSTRVPFNGRFVYQFSIQAGVRAQAAAA